MLTPGLLPPEQAKPPLLPNAGFERGLAGWTAEGDAKVVDGRLVLGPGRGAVRQRYRVPGLRVLYFGASVTPSASNVATRVRVQCLDAKGRTVMDLRAAPDAKNYPAIYLKTQANTVSVILSIEKTGLGGTVLADDALLQDNDRNRIEHPPQIDLDAAMRPFWKGDAVFEESALLLSTGGGPAQGRLAFRPTRVLSVRDSTLAHTFTEGKDFAVEADRIVALPGSPIPTMRDTEFTKGELPWTRLDGRHVFVSYRHDDAWAGPVPPFQGDRLPETTRRLRARRPLRIVALGDSITQGVNVSGFRNVPPYLPPWPDLVARQLGTNVRVVNVALGGQTSFWGRDVARDAVAALDPDLVLVAFGMNDFWSVPPAEFRRNVEAIMAIVRERRPKCEFLLVAAMRFDPAYTADPTYRGNFDGYVRELHALAGRGVAVLDMTALSEALYRAKSPKDLQTDPLHPDDFLARVYAQATVATLTKP